MLIKFELDLKITIFRGMAFFSLADMEDVSKGFGASIIKADH